VSHKTAAATLEWLRTVVWPNGKLIQAGLAQTKEQDNIMRKRNKDFLVNKLKNSYVSSSQVQYRDVHTHYERECCCDKLLYVRVLIYFYTIYSWDDQLINYKNYLITLIC
jgi:hypothetical protein